MKIGVVSFVILTTCIKTIGAEPSCSNDAQSDIICFWKLLICDNLLLWQLVNFLINYLIETQTDPHTNKHTH